MSEINQNWKKVIKLMKNHYYNYEHFDQLITQCRFIDETQKVEITTNKRAHIFPYSNIENILAQWIPINYNGVQKFDHMESLRRLNDATPDVITPAPISIVKSEPSPQNPETPNTDVSHTEEHEQEEQTNESYEELKATAFRMEQEHRAINSVLNEKLKAVIEKLNVDRPDQSTINMAKHMGSLTNQLAKSQANEIKSIHLIKDIIMPKGNIINDNKKKATKKDNEKSNDNKKD